MTRTSTDPAQGGKARAEALEKRGLQRMRRAAGYRSAKDFAEELGIPASTYARYERTPEGPDACSIPIRAAWRIADALGCSIDEVVGREGPKEETRKGAQEACASLSPEERARLEGYLDCLRSREGGR